MTAKTRDPWPADTVRLRVHDLEIDLERRTLRTDDGRVDELPQRVFELFRVFLAEPGRLQTREALFARVWPGVVVEDANLSQSVWLLRRALGPSRRDWIRTMARSGYLFEPPTALQALPAAPPPLREAGGDPTGIAPLDAEPAAGAATGAPPQRLHWFAAAAAALLLCLGADRPRPAAIAETALPVTRVALVETRDAGGDAAISVEPLQAWLRWTLEQTPDAVVLAADGSAPDCVVRVDAVMPAGREAVHLRLLVRHPSRAGRPARSWRLERLTSRDRMPQAIDAMAREALRRIVPRRSGDPWPTFALDADAAARFAQASRALREDDWRTADAATQALVQRAPAFAPGHQLRARALARRGRLAEAGREMEAARQLAWPMSVDARRVLDAQALATARERREEAIAAYDALARRWPGRREFALASAGLLLRAGRPREALSRIEALRAAPGALSDADAPRVDLVRAESLAALGAADAATEGVHAAMSSRAGRGLPRRERASARLLLANLHHGAPGRDPSPALYEQAAQDFDAAGDALGAQYARALADLVRPGDARMPTPAMRDAIALADAQGNPGVGIEVLRNAALRAYRAGDYADYRALLDRAQSHAIRAGDVAYQRAFDVDLLAEDLFVGNVAGARMRAARLRGGGLDGGALLQVPLLESTLLYYDGQPKRALAHLREAESSIRRIGAMPAFPGAQFACARVDILMSLGRIRDARAWLGACRGQDIPTLRIVADLMDAEMALLEGDATQARARLALAERALAARPDNLERWTLVAGVATLQSRMGDPARAQSLLETALPGVRREGYALLEAQMEAALAEAAASRDDWPVARAHAQRARALPPARLWLVARRLDALDVVDAIAHGDAADARLRIAALAQRADAAGDRILGEALEKLRRQDARDGSAGTLPGARLDWMLAPPRRVVAR